MVTITTKEDAHEVPATHPPARLAGCAIGGGPAHHNFEQIYARYHARIYYLCLSLTGNTEDAEDLAQEAFVRMMERLGTFRGESAFYTWLRRLAINVVLLRFQKASFRREVSLEGLTEPAAACGGNLDLAVTDGELTSTLDRICLERALEHLSPGFKAVFVLHDMEGYEHNEIARRLGCSIGTSKSQLHKARLKMRELLGEAWRKHASRSPADNNLGAN